MKYKITSRREEAVTIDGLGVLPPATREGKTEDDPGTLVPSVTIVESNAAAMFAMQRGITLANVQLPADVDCTVVLGEVN